MRSPRPTGSISSSRSVRSTRDRTPGTSGRGVTYYNFTSDQFTGFHAIVVPGTIRDSLYVLDGLLEHETSLEASEIVTDTAAYQRPHLLVVPPARVSSSARASPTWGAHGSGGWTGKPGYGVLDGLARSRISLRLIRSHWDDILRVAGSLAQGTVRASELIRSLQRGGKPSSLSRAIASGGTAPVYVPGIET